MIQTTIPPDSEVAHGTDRLGNPFVIRTFSPDLRQKLRGFYEHFEPKRAAQGLPPADPARIDSWLDSIIATGLHLVAFRQDEIIGHGLVMPTTREGIGEYAVFLSQDQRGRGIGTELNRAVAVTARGAGLRGLWLTVEPRNLAAIRSYQKAGFRFIPHTVFSVEPEMALTL